MINYKIVSTSMYNKPWLTLVHGFSQNYQYFSPILPNLSRKFRLLLIDLRGHGGSSDLPGPYGIQEYADDIIAVFDKEKIENTHYWATHTGTAVGLVLILKEPERFKSLILEGAVLPGLEMIRTAELLSRASVIAKSEGVQRALDDWFEQADWFSYMRNYPEKTNAKGQRDLLNQFSGAPWLSDLKPRPVPEIYSKLAHIPHKVLVYNGIYDLVEFKQIALTLETGLKNVIRKEIPDAGGFPLWENPKVVVPMVINFFKDVKLSD